MRKIYLFLFAFLFSAFVCNAQHFVFDPTDNYEKTVSNVYWTHHTVFMQNLTGGELILSWERLEIDFPAEWQADLCDYVNCYMGIPESGTMLAISDTTRGFLKITLNPNGFVGTGTVSFRVYDNKHPEMADTVHFTIHTAVLYVIVITESKQKLQVYPNPADDHVFLILAYPESAEIKIVNASGQTVLSQNLQEGLKTQLAIGHLPKGLYFIVLTNDSGILERQKLVIQ